MKHYFKIFILRLKAIDKTLIFLALISSISIIWIENKIIDENFRNIVSLKIFLKLSYTYLSAFIFYILVVFLPKERRQSYLYLAISNNIIGIHNKILNILLTIKFTNKTEIKYFVELQGAGHKLDLNEIMEIAKHIDPLKPPRILGETRFSNWYEYLTAESKLLKQYIERLSQLYVDLNPEIIERTEILYNNIDILDFNGKVSGNKNLEFCCNTLINLYESSDELGKAYKSIYKEKYGFEFHKRARKLNKIRKS